MKRQDLELWLCVALCALGVYFRTTHLSRKVFWNDEALTALKAGGHAAHDLERAAASRPEMTAGEVMEFQRPGPGGLADVARVALREPYWPPAYYLATRLWIDRFGVSIASFRSLSVLFGLLCFPAIFWVGLELFGSSRTAWAALAVFAISPFHVLYAQEARCYSLWTFVILLACGALLRATRLGGFRAWTIYALALAAAFYVQVFSLGVLLGHGVFVGLKGSRRKLRDFSYAVGAALIAWAPWSARSLRHVQPGGAEFATLTSPVSSARWVISAIYHLSTVFYDAGLASDSSTAELTAGAPWAALALVLPALGLWRLSRRRDVPAVFLSCLAGSGLAFYGVADLLLGAHYLDIPRYQIPFYLSVELVVAAVLAEDARWTFPAAVALAAAGALSCAWSSGAESWSNKWANRGDPALARRMNAARQAVVLVDRQDANRVLALAWRLDPGVKIRFYVGAPELRKDETPFVLADATRTRPGLEPVAPALKPK